MSTNADRYIAAVEKAIVDSTNISLVYPRNIENHAGCSDINVQAFLNSLCSYSWTRHLHIGVRYGKTLLGALYNNKPEVAIAIDIDAEYDGCKNISKEHGINYEYIHQNSWDVDRSRIRDINVYFYDGEHGKDGHEKALTYYTECMASEFIFIVDDWGADPDARYVTLPIIERMNLKIIKQWELGTGDIRYWNGLGVFILSKP